MKHLIKIESTAHGVLGVRHAGRDQQYCEAGETVVLKWQPDAGWGLKEAHITDKDGNVTAIEGGEFIMPDSAVTVGGTFKRFLLDDWANDPYKPQPQPTPKYLKFTAGENGGDVGFVAFNAGYELPEDYETPKIEYSLDGGLTWQPYEVVVTNTVEAANIIRLEAGESVLFRGNNETLAYYLEDDDDYVYFRTYMNAGPIAASGDVTALLNGFGGDVAIAENCYSSMFSGCTGLTEAPALPATTLASYCYSSMFYGCTGLTQAPSLPATTLAESCYSSMFYGCTGITSHDVATLNNSSNTFNNNSSCTSLTIHADTPPTIGNNTITGLNADCIIYVPAASVDAYKAAQYWSARAAYIQAIP